jgi:hypothetical protein
LEHFDVMPLKHDQFKPLTAVLLGLAATATSAVAASNCPNQPFSLQATYVNNGSDWREFDTKGGELVHESGTLQGPQVTVALSCWGWNFQAQLSQLDGDRDYDGQTSSGTAILSQSALHQLHRQVQTTVNATDAWSLGLRLSNQVTWRDIASAGGASGYPERFEWTLLSLGSQWRFPVGPGQLTLAAWAGKQLNSSMTLHLPGRDQTALALGTVSQIELQIGWRIPLSTDWGLQADASYRRTDIGQGADAVVTRNGRPTGIAHQPQSRTVDVPISIRIDYKF